MKNAQNNTANSTRQPGPKNPDNWARIEAVINMAQMTTNAFARHIGLPRGENLYQIKRGNNGISFDVADRICCRVPEISKLWLLTGDGKMFLSTHRPALGIKLIAAMRDQVSDDARLCPHDDSSGIGLIRYAAERLDDAANPNLPRDLRIIHLTACGGIIAAEIDRLMSEAREKGGKQ